MARHILVIDQGTTSTRGIVFDAGVTPIATAQQEFTQLYPRPGWVEHDPEAIWESVLATARQALASAGLTADDIAALGMTNQRETVVVWDRRTGRAIHNAIVWQDRRTSEVCERLENQGLGKLIADRTGLRLDPYFSATKIAWLLDSIDGARAARRTHPAPCCSTSTTASGTTICWVCSASLARCCRTCATRPGISARPACLAGRSRYAASPATSRPLWSARPASRPAW
jgi:glycerol kinase